MRTKDMLTFEKEDWRTPKEFFDRLNDEFHFDLDAASSDENALCADHFTVDDDGLSQDWGGETEKRSYSTQTGISGDP